MNIFFCYFIIVYKILYFLFSRYRFTFIDRLYFLLFKHFLFLYKILYTFLNLLLSFKERKKNNRKHFDSSSDECGSKKRIKWKERKKKLVNKGYPHVSRSYLISKRISTIVKIDDSINTQVIFNLNSKVENVEEHRSIVVSHFQLNIDIRLNRFNECICTR